MKDEYKFYGMAKDRFLVNSDPKDHEEIIKAVNYPRLKSKASWEAISYDIVFSANGIGNQANSVVPTVFRFRAEL